MDPWQLMESHPALQTSQPARASWVNTEYRAMIAGGLDDNEWFAMSRPQRAARVAHLIGNEAVSAAVRFDQAEEAKRKK